MRKKVAKLFILSAPSGAGKSTIIQKALQDRKDLYFSVSVTTRPPRESEVHGREYYFIDEAEFTRLALTDGLLEHARYVGSGYGTPRAEIEAKLEAGIHVLLEIEVQGAMQVKAKMPQAVTIFLSPPSITILEERLRGRGTDTEEKIRKRLETATAELANLHLYDYLIINDTIDRAVEEFNAILLAEECKIIKGE